MDSKKSNHLVLGTAQLGMNYGIANMTGQPAYNIAESIVREAWELGVCEFDTAQAYGQSEQVLGQVFKKMGIADEVRIITKFDPGIDYFNKADINKSLEISLKKLGVEHLYCLMIHREEMLDLWESGLKKNLMDIVASGKVKYIGVSVYSPRKAVQALNIEGISIVQLPTNIIDRRFEEAGVFDLADNTKKIIYIRSIFLQGLLLIPPDQLPKHMQFAEPVLKKLKLFSQNEGLSIMELCIGYIKHTFYNSKFIFGAELPSQVKENLKCWDMLWPEKLTQKIQLEFEDINSKILNPSLWPKGYANA